MSANCNGLKRRVLKELEKRLVQLRGAETKIKDLLNGESIDPILLKKCLKISSLRVKSGGGKDDLGAQHPQRGEPRDRIDRTISPVPNCDIKVRHERIGRTRKSIRCTKYIREVNREPI